MARTKKSAKLDTWNARKKLAAEERHQEPLSPGRYLVYRRPKSGAAGSWAAYWCDLETKKKVLKRLGTADDFQDADGLAVLTYAQAQAKAQAWFTTREHQALHGDASQPQDGVLTVSKAIERYLARNEAQGGKSAKDMRQRAELWINPSLGAIEVAKLTRTKVGAWHQAIADSDRKTRPKKEVPKPKRPRKKKEAPEDKEVEPEKKTSSPEDDKRKRKATANRVLSILKAALSCAREHGWVVCSGDAWELVKPFRGVEEPRQDYLNPQEQQRLLNAIQAPDFRKLVSGALTTGCRYGELCRMQVRDFDPTGAGSVLVREAKGGKPRRVLLTKEGRAFFQSISSGREGDELMFRRETAERRTRGGDPLAWGKNDQQRIMRNACEAAGLTVMGFHQLRHSYASALVAAGMPLAMVAKLTGHADTRMLEKHYAHLAPSDLSRALEAMAPSLNLPSENTSELSIIKPA